jgi:hypothetical protein
LHVPEWFKRKGFLDWRQGRAPDQWEAPACWHPEERDGEHLDVFIVFDRRTIDPFRAEPNLWDGTDIASFRDDIYAAIGTVHIMEGFRQVLTNAVAELNVVYEPIQSPRGASGNRLRNHRKSQLQIGGAGN